LIVDGYRGYSRQDDFSQEGRAMSNAILGVAVFVPRPTVPNMGSGFRARTVPIV
jgi:hypothetical protein